MFKRKKQNYEKMIEDVKNLDEENLINLYLKTIAKGEIDAYIYILEQKTIKRTYLLEQALVYGRYEILENMLDDNDYKKELQTIYDPFILEHCDPDVTDDIYDGSWWSNDEHERPLINKRDINHKKCFEMLKKFNKKLVTDNCIKWMHISNNQVKYFGGCYFSSYKILIEEIFNEKPTIVDVIHLLIDDFSAKFIIKVLCEIFSSEEILSKLCDMTKVK
jgi:hypothetical protein